MQHLTTAFPAGCKMLAPLVWLLSLLVWPSLSAVPQMTTYPVNRTVNVGDTVHLNCQTSVNATPLTFDWRRYQDFSMSSSSQIYLIYGEDYIPNAQFATTKFIRNGTYGLTISQVDWTDGLLYSCAFQYNGSEAGAMSSLVVIDTLEAKILSSSWNAEEESTSVNGTMEKTSTNSSLMCNLKFGGPPDLSQVPVERRPQMKLTFGNREFLFNLTLLSSPTEDYVDTATNTIIHKGYSRGTPGTARQSMSMTVSYPLTNSDVGKTLTCTVTTPGTNPAYSKTTTTVYYNTVQNWNLTISPVFNVYYLDDVVNCSYPEQPNGVIYWHPVDGPYTASIEGGMLTMTAAMAGNNTWQCRVYQMLGNPPMNTQEMSFELINMTRAAAFGTDTKDDDSAKKIGLGVGLGVGLGLLLLIVIIAIIIFCSRKKKQGGAGKVSKKSAAKSSAPVTTGGYTALSSDANDPVAPPIYQPRSNAAVPLTGAARTGSPAALSNEPSVNGSLNQSGHGDLGGPNANRPSSQASRTNSSVSNVPSTGPIIRPQPQKAGFMPLVGSGAGAGMGPGGAGMPFLDTSHDTGSVASGPPQNASMRTSSSSLARPTAALGGRTYQQQDLMAPPRNSSGSGGHATGV
jgi:hypothetical protein